MMPLLMKKNEWCALIALEKIFLKESLSMRSKNERSIKMTKIVEHVWWIGGHESFYELFSDDKLKDIEKTISCQKKVDEQFPGILKSKFTYKYKGEERNSYYKNEK